MPRTGSICLYQYGALPGECFLGAYHAELVSLGIGQDRPGLCASLPDVDPARPQRDKPLNFLVAVLRTAGQIEVHAVLDRLRIGNRHEAHADGRVVAGPDDDLTLPLGQNLPPERLGPEPGQPWQVVSVNDDVMQSDRHAVSMCGRAGLHPRTRPPLPRGGCSCWPLLRLGRGGDEMAAEAGE